MKTFLVLSCLLGWALSAPTAPAPAPKPPAFSLSYTHAGLTSLTVKDRKLKYVWHTLRKQDKGSGPLRASMESYDRHEIDVWLTEAEWQQFQECVRRNKLFKLDRTYPSTSKGARASAYQSGLTFSLGGKTHGIGWVGDSKTPTNLDTAVNEMVQLADKINHRSK